MAILTIDANGIGKPIFEGSTAFRQKDDASDNKVAGVYSHLALEFSGTEANEWQSLMQFLCNVCRQGGGSISVRNATGGSLPAGPVSISGVYITGNEATLVTFLVVAADAAGNTKPAHALLLVALANNTTGTAYLAGTFTGTIDLSGGAVGDAIYLAAGGGYTRTAPSGADQIVQEIGRIQNNINNGPISGGIRPPTKFGTSWHQNKSITAALQGSGAATSGQALYADGAGGAAYRSMLDTDIPATLAQSYNFTGTLKRQGYNIYFQNATPAIVAGDYWYEISTGLLWVCDGTYWLSFELFQMTGSVQNASSSQNFGLTPTRNNQATYYDILMFDFCGVLNFSAGNTNTDYWIVKLQRFAANGATTDLATISGQGQTSAQYIAATSQRINTRLQSSTDAKLFSFINVATGAPGNLYSACSFTYRWIHP